MPSKLRIVPIAVVIATAVAGCGGSNATSKRKLVAEADGICKQISVERTAANKQVSKANGSTAKALAVLARVAPPVAADEHREIARLRALKVPSSLTADWQKLLTGMEQLANDASQIGSKAAAKDYKGIVSVTASGRKIRKSITAIATHDGFSYCGLTS